MFLDKKDVKFTNMGGGITRRSLGKGDDIMACVMNFEKGSCVEPHSHKDHEQFIMVLNGKFELTCGNEKRIVVAGGCCYARKNEVHATLALEDNSSLLDMHTPLRMDILEDPNATIDKLGEIFYI